MSRPHLLAWIALVAAAAALASILLPPALAALVDLLAVSVVAVMAWRRGRGRFGRSPSAPARPVELPVRALERVLDPIDAAVLLLDAELTVLGVNRSAERLFAQPRGTMTGRSLIRVTRDHDLLQCARSASGEPVEIVLDGTRTLRAVAAGVDADPVRVVLAVDDVSEVRAAQRARRELIANVSHELRTPIAAALALAETLEGGVPDEARRGRFAAQLVSEVRRLHDIVERLLHLSRLESDRERLNRAPVDPLDLMKTAAARIAPLAGGREIEIARDPEPTDLPEVIADRERVLEVLSNLLDNALRYTAEGGTVRLAATAEGADVRFDVVDEGPGVLPGERERIFERFYTGDPSRRSVGGGAGLGLSIARHIVERHGGRIWVGDSDRGARLCFTLPVASAAADATVER